MRFHLKESGEPGLCLAFKRSCPLGGEHFDSLKEARNVSESFLASGFGNGLGGLSKKSKRQEPTSVKIGKAEHGVVDDDEKSRFFCKACGERFSYDSYTELIGGERGYCPCGEVTKLGSDNLLIQRSSLWLLDAKNYGNETNVLYHVTTKATWSEYIKANEKLQIHLGDLETTQRRVNDMVYTEDAKPPFYLHKTRLKTAPEASVNLAQDLNNGWDSLEGNDDIHVYPNQWKNPEALSVMTIQKNFEVFEVSKPLSFREAGL